MKACKSINYIFNIRVLIHLARQINCLDTFVLYVCVIENKYKSKKIDS